MKALIKVGYGCNNHCTFCHTLDVRHVDGEGAEIERKIDRAARLGHSMIVLSGGEVTMRPELLKWAARSHALGLEFGLVTNGRALAYPELVDKLLSLRLRYVYLSMHGGNAKIHNLLVRADAFEQTYAAVKNLSGKGIDLWVNTVVTRQNLEHLRGVVDAMLPFRDAVLKFSMVAPKGGGEKHFDRLTPRVSDVAARVRDAIEYGLSKTGGEGPHFAHDGIPFCLLPSHEHRYDDLKTHAFRTMVEIGEPDFFPVDDLHKVQPEACDDCALRGPCPGLYRGYPEVHGTGEIAPVRRRARPRSFGYDAEKVVGRLASDAPDGCPVLRDGTTPWDRGRDVFVRRGDAVARFRAETRDFTDVEIARTKHDRGQLYVEVGEDGRARRKLRRATVCDGCEARDRCAGMFEAARDDVLARDEALVRGRLAALAGDVVAIGEERPAALASSARVTTIAPDAPVAIELGEATIDAAVIVGGWNRLERPSEVVRALARALREGGELVVVDDVAFGLVRAPGRRANGEAASTQFRNDGVDEAERVVRGCGLACVERRDVAPETSPRWWLVAKKR